MTPLRNGDLLAAVSPRTGELRWTRLTQRPVHAGHAPAGTPQPVVRSLEWVKDATEENDQLGKLHHVAARATYSCSKPSGCPMASASWTLVPTGHGHAVSSGAPQPVFPGPLWMPDDATTKTHCHHIAAGRYRLRLAVEDIYGRHASTQRAVRLARPAAVGECGQTIPFPTIGGGTGR
jgi:hypothetical protein